MIAIIISILAAIPVGIGVNLVTPWVKTNLATYNKTRRDARILKVQNEYLAIQAFRQGRDTNRFISRLAQQSVYLIAYFVAIVVFLILSLYGTTLEGLRYSLYSTPAKANSIVNGFPSAHLITILALAFTVLFLAAVTFIFINITRLLSNVLSKSDPYRKAAERTLQKLGSSLPSIEEVLNSKEPPKTGQPSPDNLVDVAEQVVLRQSTPESAEPG